MEKNSRRTSVTGTPKRNGNVSSGNSTKGVCTKEGVPTVDDFKNILLQQEGSRILLEVEGQGLKLTTGHQEVLSRVHGIEGSS